VNDLSGLLHTRFADMAVPTNVAALLEQRAAGQPDMPFIKCSAGWRPFVEVESAAERLACGLTRIGVKKGDRVGVIAENRDELFDLLFACAKIGAIEVSFNTFLKGSFLSYQLADADLSVVVADQPGCRALEAVLHEVQVPTVITLDDVSPQMPGTMTYGFGEIAAGPATRAPTQVLSSDLLAILYTSGTTGSPKGCMLPHGYFLNSPKQYFADERVVPGDRIYCAYPFFHTSAQLYVLMQALAGPCSVVVAPTFSASAFMNQAKAEGAVRLLGVAAMGKAILAQPESEDDADPGTIRTAHWLPFAEEDQLEFERRFHIPTWGEGFGQTECTPICHTHVTGPRNRRSCGLPAEWLELAIMDDDGRILPSGNVGEIVIRPKVPNSMYQGYWRNPEATVQNMQHYWHHTGDYGRQDDDGFVFFVDRKKQAIRRRGENISSIEVEAAIRRHPAIRDVAVHAVPSSMSEDDVKAVIVLADGADIQPAELFGFFRDSLPYFAVPRYVERRTQLPVNVLGRVMKHVLREEGVTPGTWDMEALGFVIGRDERR
jgi:crotonobetaine/carnitine-CoA ligase